MSASVRRHRRLIHSVIVIVSLPWMYWYDSISNSNSNSNSMQTMCLCIVFILQIRSWNNEWFDSIRFDSWMNESSRWYYTSLQPNQTTHHATILTTTILTIQSINLQQSIQHHPPSCSRTQSIWSWSSNSRVLGVWSSAMRSPSNRKRRELLSTPFLCA